MAGAEAAEEGTLIRATNHSSFPKLGEGSLDQQLRSVLRSRERGRASVDEVSRVTDEVTAITVAEQCRAFIDVVTDGMIGWEGPLSHVARRLSGARLGGLRRWFHANFYDRRVEIVGPVRRTGPITVRDYKVAVDVAQPRPVKAVLPGPVTFARLARDSHYGDLDRLADDLAQAFAEEFAELAAAGATCFQIDEPLLCRHPEDLRRVARTAARVFEPCGGGATTILSTYFGDLDGVGVGVRELPGTHVGLDLAGRPANFGLLRSLRDDQGVSLGLFDVGSTRQEDAAEVAASLQPHRERLVGRDVLVGPNAGLELLPRDRAFDKLLHARYLVERLSEEWSWA